MCCVHEQAVQQAMSAEYNESQMTAVTAGLDRSPVILIQVATLSSGPLESPSRDCSASLSRGGMQSAVRNKAGPWCPNGTLCHAQGPPGTGKTRTIMGLLSIILHASPANTAGLVQRAAAKPMPEVPRADLDRLWRLASPWLSGAANPRSAHPMYCNF